MQKLTVYAWSTWDSNSKLPANQQPSTPLLAFLGYAFFFPSFLIGPGVHYSAYTTYASAPLPAGRSIAALKRTIIALSMLAIFVLASPNWSYNILLRDEFLKYSWIKKIALTNVAGFVARTKYYAIWCLSCVVSLFFRCAILTSKRHREAACITSGIARIDTLTQKDEQWSGARNVRIIGIEFAENWKVLLDNCQSDLGFFTL